MIRIVIQHSPKLFTLAVADETQVPQTFRGDDGVTYYKSQEKVHYILFKPAISGWGAAAPNPSDPRPVFNPSQR